MLCIVDARTKISNQSTYEGFAYLANNTNSDPNIVSIDKFDINSLSIIDNKLYGLTSDSKLVIISDLHKTTDKYSVTPPINLNESYDQIFKLKNHDDNS